MLTLCNITGFRAGLRARCRTRYVMAATHLRRSVGNRGRPGAIGVSFAIPSAVGGWNKSPPVFVDRIQTARDSMAERKNTHGLQVTHRDGCTVVDIGSMEIWDGADLSLIRDTLSRLVVGQRQRSIGIDMSNVKYVPSGFFGMLFDWFEAGITVRLFSPQPRVANMLWFKRFFESENEETFCLTSESADYVEPEPEDEEALDDLWLLDRSDSELSSVQF